MTTSAPPAEDVRAELTRITETLQKLAATRQQLAVQLNENEGVKGELDLLGADAELFRTVGPAMVKMDVVDARALVDGRIAAIKGDIKRLEEQFEEAGKRRLQIVEKLPGSSGAAPGGGPASAATPTAASGAARR